MSGYQIGYGRCGDVEVTVDEWPEDPDRWTLQVDVGQFGFTCALASPERIREWAAFFAETFRTGRFLDTKLESGGYRYMDPQKELELGRIGDIPILINKCGMFDDRYFLIVRVPGGRVVHTPTLAQVEALIDAVNQVVTDLAD